MLNKETLQNIQAGTDAEVYTTTINDNARAGYFRYLSWVA
jgi:hypothetical protein